MDLKKKCNLCEIPLTTDNAAKKNAKYYRNICKKCRSAQVTKYNIGNPKRQKYMREYIRRKGIVKEYPCETCGISCYKKYARAFCSDLCRFMAYVDKQENCWIWVGAKKRKGYGKLCFKNNNSATASRVSYELFIGPIENGMFICHTCDNPSCVKPDHLWAGTHVENMIDMTQKGRQHSKLTPFDVIKLRKMWDEGWSNQSLAHKFNITSGTVSNIIKRRLWAHV